MPRTRGAVQYTLSEEKYEYIREYHWPLTGLYWDLNEKKLIGALLFYIKKSLALTLYCRHFYLLFIVMLNDYFSTTFVFVLSTYLINLEARCYFYLQIWIVLLWPINNICILNMHLDAVTGRLYLKTKLSRWTQWFKLFSLLGWMENQRSRFINANANMQRMNY